MTHRPLPYGPVLVILGLALAFVLAFAASTAWLFM